MQVGYLKQTMIPCQIPSANICLMTKYGYHRRRFTDLSGVLTALTDSAYGYCRSLTTPTDIVGSTQRLQSLSMFLIIVH